MDARASLLTFILTKCEWLADHKRLLRGQPDCDQEQSENPIAYSYDRRSVRRDRPLFMWCVMRLSRVIAAVARVCGTLRFVDRSCYWHLTPRAWEDGV
jgi:hypothetical protein